MLLEDMMISLSSTMLLRINCYRRVHNSPSKMEYVDTIDTSVASINTEYCEQLVELCLQLGERAIKSHGRSASVQASVTIWKALIRHVEPKRLLSPSGKHARKLVLQSMLRMLDLESPANEVITPDSEIFVSRLQVTKEDA